MRLRRSVVAGGVAAAVVIGGAAVAVAATSPARAVSASHRCRHTCPTPSPQPTPTVTPTASGGASGIRVSANHLINGAGTVVLRGVDRSGTEYACVQGWGLFDGPSDAASVQAIKSWGTNAVRVPLNEDCWLGINGVPAAFAGSNYITAIVNYVNLLNQNGLYAILDLHWSAPGSTKATGQQPMPDQDHSPAFWTSVASTFKGNPAVVFDLFNEPYPDNNGDTAAAWSCWKNGGTCSGVSYQVAGMQELVTTVRNAGAPNVIMLGGVQYSNALDGWLANEPSDPRAQTAASFHNYNFNACSSTTCWNNVIAPLARSVPVITGEFGENDTAGTFMTSWMSWADSEGVSYLAWTWDTWGCSGGEVLITDYSGTPCQSDGTVYQQHLLSLK
ncbi:MAG TPA: cellulase family glycosylhydrolase [Candidatus Dormibacteraeota bacterium]